MYSFYYRCVVVFVVLTINSTREYILCRHIINTIVSIFFYHYVGSYGRSQRSPPSEASSPIGRRPAPIFLSLYYIYTPCFFLHIESILLNSRLTNSIAVNMMAFSLNLVHTFSLVFVTNFYFNLFFIFIYKSLS